MSPSTWFRTMLVAGGAMAMSFAIALPATAQQTGTIQGTVTASGSNNPLVGVQLFIAGATGAQAQRQVAISDENGRYTLANVPAGAVQVRARLVGYTSRSGNLTLVAGQTAELNLTLSRSVIALDEIVVSGAGGATEKKQLGNTIATLDVASAIETQPIQSFSQALQGREPSVQGLPSGGLAGEGTRIRIRGTNSLSMSNEPVVYVDGVRIDNAGGFDEQVGAGGGGVSSRLDDIDPQAIDRIEILKGAAAATLYGSEASSGVIQIFTKSGSRGRPRFNFRFDFGAQKFPNVFKPNSGFARDQAQADTMSEMYGFAVSPFSVVQRKFVDDMTTTGNSQTYSGSVTGGGDDLQYFGSLRFARVNGPFGGEELGPAADIDRRFQLNTSVTLFPRSRLNFRLGAFYTSSAHETPNNNNNIYGVASLAMFGKPELSNCDASSRGSGFYGETTPICTGAGNPTGQIAFSTVRESMQQETKQDVEHFNANLAITYQASSSIQLEGIFGVDAVNGNSFEFAPFGYNVDDFTGNNVNGFRNIGTRRHNELTFDIKGRWNERFGFLSSDLTIGGQGFISQNKTSGGFGSQFPGPGLEVAGAAASQTLRESELRTVNVGGFAQWQAGLNDIAYVTLGGRLDRNSAFGESQSAAFYPKASVSIIFSDLQSWNSSLLSTFRIRGAVGKSGLQPGAFDKFTTFGPAPTFAGAGLEPDNLGNSDLAPEKSTEFEIGTELGLFDNIMSLDFTWWQRTTKDAMIARQFPVSGGFLSSQLVNIGELTGKGAEIKFNWLAVDKQSFGMEVFANASYLKENITDMGTAPPIKAGGSYPRYRNFLKEGYAPGSHFGAILAPYVPGSTVPYDTNNDGNLDTEAEFKAWLGSQSSIELSQSEMNPIMGDEDGDGDNLDHFLGKPTPDWQGGFGLNFTLWTNLQLNTMFEYRAGNYFVNNLTDAFRKSNPSIGRNTPQAAQVESTLLNPGTQSNVDARFDAAMQWATQLKALSPYSGLNTIESADFVRWRELGIVYSANGLASKLGLGSLTFAAMGRNLLMISGYSGVDQEVNALGRCGGNGAASRDCNFLDSVEAFGLPIPREFILSVRFGF